MKPSVLHIIDSFEQGGTERQAIQLVRLLQAEGRYDVRLACLNKHGVLLGEAEQLGLGEIIEYPLNSFYDRNFTTQLCRCVRFLKEHEVKVIHTHDFYTNIFGMIAARLARVPARIASKRETEGFRTRGQKRVERAAYRLAHAVVANAEAVRALLISDGVPPRKIVTLYNGLDLSRVVPRADLSCEALLSALGLPASVTGPVVTIIANLRHGVKDHPMFIRAARRVHERVPAAAFVIAGEGELTEKMRALGQELGLGQSLFFIGRCERVADLLAASDVCVLSSRAEGFSNAILEYMAAARPVVATDVGGAREAVVEGETGYLIPSGDDELMAARIVALLEEPERARAMGLRGKQVIEENFSCEAQLTRTLALYERLLAEAQQPRPKTGQKETSIPLRSSLL